ncbi:MAG: hypothetical protein QOJ72_1364, partial [Nocardioidaceae bacterium]|nr:hypothetical protein [Nocardioidaceae bacterium]
MKEYRAFLIPVIAAGLAFLAYLIPSHSEHQRPPSRVAVAQASYGCPAGKTITVAGGQVRPGTSSTATVLPGTAKDAALAGASSWRT